VTRPGLKKRKRKEGGRAESKDPCFVRNSHVRGIGEAGGRGGVWPQKKALIISTKLKELKRRLRGPFTSNPSEGSPQRF